MFAFFIVSKLQTLMNVLSRITLFMFCGTSTTFITNIYIHHIPHILPVLEVYTYIGFSLNESSSE